MLQYCLKCRKKKESKKPQVTKTNKEKIMLLSNCQAFCSKKLRFIQKRSKQVIK